MERIKVKNDARLWIAEGINRYDTQWKNKQVTWSGLLSRIQTPTRTQEAYSDYIHASKPAQERIKDVGGFVGGTLKDGHRRADSVTGRQIVSLDLDAAAPGAYDALSDGFASACYSTHKHCPDKPRYRILVPLDRIVSADEYEAISRKLAADLELLEQIDQTTHQPSRLMYWPSCSRDAEYFFSYKDAPFASADDILAEYPDWRDVSQWPLSPGEVKSHKKTAEKQQDPTTKKGIVGAFCRAYDVPAAIDAFLSDIYAPAGEDRYTYTAGSTQGGVVIYEGGAFAYSNHGTDPASGQLCNAFDLVRLHLFGSEDAALPADTQPNKLPSFKAMAELAAGDATVCRVLSEEKAQEAEEDFKDDTESQPGAWVASLNRSGKGVLEKSVLNCMRIFQHDDKLQGIALDELAEMPTVLSDKPVPWARKGKYWTDADDAELYTYISTHYTEFPRQTVSDQMVIAAKRHAFHPVKMYLEELPAWDGKERADSIFIDYLGTTDNVYTREATGKTLLAAVRRVYEPGCKFDNVLVISGAQGIGKSLLISRLAGDWFSDNLTFEDMRDKTAAEKLQGFWLLEIGELKGMRKTDVESIKAFITRQDDSYRAAYGRHLERHPRRCVIFGTVNDFNGYLKDATGNRRFWPLAQDKACGTLRPWDLDAATRDQIWAEILFRYKVLGERSLLLSDKAEEMAEDTRAEATESDDREGIVREFLSRKVNADWYQITPEERVFLQNDESFEGQYQREYVSNAEIWSECFGRPISTISSRDSYDIAVMMSRIKGWERTDNRARINGYGLQRLYRRTT